MQAIAAFLFSGMRKLSFLFLFLNLAIILPLWSEIPVQVTVSGFVRDKKTGETISGAVIFPKEKPSMGVTSNSYGYYSLSLPQGSYTLNVQFLGYQTALIPVTLEKNSTVDIDLEEASVSLGEVTVTGEKTNNNLKSNQVVSKISVHEIRTIPVILGEKDILKTIQLMPGISPAGEGNA